MLKHMVLLIQPYSVLLYNYVTIYVDISPINIRFNLFKFLDVFSASMECDAMVSGARHTDTKRLSISAHFHLYIWDYSFLGNRRQTVSVHFTVSYSLSWAQPIFSKVIFGCHVAQAVEK